MGRAEFRRQARKEAKKDKTYTLRAYQKSEITTRQDGVA